MSENLPGTSFLLVFLQVDKKNYVIRKKNVHKKIEKFAKNYMYKKEKLLSSNPPPINNNSSAASTSNKQKHTKNYETFVEFKKLLRFFFFLSYTTQYKREELRKSYENQHFINKKR